ncbi:MAG TPA: MlaD family protein [Solirubrobacteraceae bacterium]|nr:MlaD family protein [Solirubrobacteraceae bacterium]
MSSLKRSPRRPARNLFRGRAAGKQRSRAFTLAVGVAVLVFFVVQFYIGYNAPNTIPGRSYYTITALMKNADNLEDHDQVRIGGELAGQVLNPHVADHVAVLQLQLASKFAPLRSDSTVRIRLRSAVGIRFVQIYPSTTGTPLPNGGVLQTTQTTSPVDLDQVLNTFDPNTQRATQNLLGQLGVGLMERGQTVNDTLGDAPGFVSALGSVMGAINARTGAIAHFITATQGTAAAIAPVRYNLADGFKPGAQALAPFVSQRASVEDTLQQLPSTLSTAQSDLPQVNAMMAQVDGLAQAAVPTLAAAPGALNQTASLLSVAKPGLRAANATLHDLSNAVDPTVSFLKTAQPELPRINQAITDLLPTVSYLGPRACGLSNAFTGWSEMMKYGNDFNNFIRFTVAKDSTIVSDTGPVLASPYPGPCVNGGGPMGGPYGTPEQQQSTPEPVYP